MMRERVAGNAACAGAAVLLLVGADANASPAGETDVKQECIVASEQGQTERDEGHYRAARKAFFSCARAACPRLIVDSCTKWLNDLDFSAPSVVLGARDEGGNDLTEVNVTFDEVPLASVLDGQPIEVDSGEHVLRFERAGSETVQQKLVLRAGEKARGVTVTLKSTGSLSKGSPAALEGAGIPAPESVRPEPVLSPRHVTAVSLGIGALAAAGTGIYFIARSGDDRGTAANLRNGLTANACTHSVSTGCRSLSETVDSQHREANVAAWLFAGAGAFAAGAAVSWFLWPAPATEPVLHSAWMAPMPGGAAVGVGGSFR